MAKTWKDSDISLDPIKDQIVAVIGYGIQGECRKRRNQTIREVKKRD